MIELDTLENQVNFIYLGIGSNLGDRKKNIEKAKFKLIETGIKIIRSSNYYETLSWPNPKNPKFINVILKVTSKSKPQKLLQICKLIEKELGRVKAKKNAPRLCDIDIIDYNNKKMSGDVILPHPRMHRRNFVLFPLFEINKDWNHPVSKLNIKNLITLLPNKDITSIKQI